MAAGKKKPGRPRKITSPSQMQEKIDKYFEECKVGEKKWAVTKDGTAVEVDVQIPATVTGLHLALDLTREGLAEYGRREKYSDIIKIAKLRIQQSTILGALQGIYNPAAAIFHLKQLGWKDKIEHVDLPTQVIVVAPPERSSVERYGAIEDNKEIQLTSPFSGVKQLHAPPKNGTNGTNGTNGNGKS